MKSLLLALKLGLFAPAGSGPMPLPYLSFDAMKPVTHRGFNVPGFELGYGLDMVRRDDIIMGKQARREVYMGAIVAGLTWPLLKSASVGVGLKYRHEDEALGGYVGLAVRFKGVKWDEPQP